MFVDAETQEKSKTKLCKNESIAEYFADPDFNTLWDASLENPGTFNALIQSDPRFMEIFKEVT